MIIIFSQNLLAFPISPARIEETFRPGLEGTYSYTVGNRGNAPLAIKMYVRGDLNESIKLETDKVVLSPGEYRKFEYYVRLPETLKPGLHENWIGAVEDTDVKGGMVGAIVGVEMQFWVFSPYPGKYLEGKLEAPNTQINEPVNFKITLSSKGLEDISNAKILLKIFDPEENQIATLEESSGLIKSMETKEINIKWDAQNAKLGNYKAKTMIIYDNKIIELEDNFKIGDILIKILNITAKDTPLGSIAKINVDIESKWNSGISDIYAEGSIFKGDSKIEGIKSESINIEPWEKKTLNIFWDTSNTEIGTYEILVKLHYYDLVSEGSTFINVVKMSFLDLILANKLILVGIVLLLLIALFNIILIVHLIKKNKSSKKGKHSKQRSFLKGKNKIFQRQ